MEEFLDEIVVMVLCTALGAWQWADPFLVAGAAAAVALASLCHLLGPAGRIAALCLFVAAATLVPACTPFLPLAAYEALHERPWAVRLLWAAPLAILGAFGVIPAPALLADGALCAIAALLAVRDVRERSERQGLRFAYDDLRERALDLRDQRDQALAACNDAAEPANHEAEAFWDLTQRELAVARLVAQGMDNREIASSLFLSEGTVRNHISAILAKKQLANRTQIAVAYYRGI